MITFLKDIIMCLLLMTKEETCNNRKLCNVFDTTIYLRIEYEE